jgi:hypothetical protein
VRLPTTSPIALAPTAVATRSNSPCAVIIVKLTGLENVRILKTAANTGQSASKTVKISQRVSLENALVMGSALYIAANPKAINSKRSD